MTIRWRERQFWLRVGYLLTFGWLVAVYEITGGNSEDPLFRFIFIVPLGAWILYLVLARILGRKRSGDRA